MSTPAFSATADKRRKRIRIIKIGAPLLALDIILLGFALKMMWNWFVVAALSQASHIGMATATGLIVLRFLFTKSGLAGDSVDEVKIKGLVTAYLMNYFVTLSVLSIGLSIHVFWS